jgi:hypothetical protein
LVAAFEFVVVMEQSAQTRSGRRVRGVWRLERTASGVDLEELPAISGKNLNDNPQSRCRAEPWFPVDELSQRQHILCDLRDRHIEQLPVVPYTGSGGSNSRQP